MKLSVLLLFFLLFSLTLTAKVRRIGDDFNENQNFVENNDVDINTNRLEKLWRAMKHRFGQEERQPVIDSQANNQQDNQVDVQQKNQTEIQLNEKKELTEGDKDEDKDGLEIVNNKEDIDRPVNKTIEQNNNEEQPETPALEDRPNQMAPITKALLYIRPKRDERWVMLEEGLIKWAISSYLQPYASEVLMNCNLYRDGNMILSVFRGVPLSVGTESWTPPGFLEPAPNYQLRLWNQPSRIGLIDEYSVLFSIVPSADDAFMFNSDPKIVINDTIQNEEHNTNADEDDNMNQKATITTEKVDQSIAITQKHTKTILPGMSNSDFKFNLNKQSSSGSNVAIPPNIPTGIYALYPSMSLRVSPTSICALWSSAFLVTYFLSV